MDPLKNPRTNHLYITPCSPYRCFATVLPGRQELYDAVAAGDLDSLRNYRAYWNTPICTYRQPGYGEIFTTPQMCLLLQQERLLNYLLADPFTDVEAKSSPSGWTLLMIACAADAKLGFVSLILQRANSKGHINTISASGNTALDCARPGSSGALLAEEVRRASGSGDAEVRDGKIEKATGLRGWANKVPKELHGNEHAKGELQELSRSASGVSRGEASHKPKPPSLARSPQGLTSSHSSVAQKEVPRSYPRQSVSLPESLSGKDAVLSRSQPGCPTKRGGYRESKPKANDSADGLQTNPKPLAPGRSQTDTSIHNTGSVRPSAVKAPPGTLNGPSGETPATKPRRRLTSSSGRRLLSKVSLSDVPPQKEEIAHADCTLQSPPHEGAGEDMKCAFPPSALAKACSLTATKYKGEATLAKRFHSLASVNFESRPQKSASDDRVGQDEESQQTDSRFSSGCPSVDKEGSRMPPNRTETASRPVELHAQPGAHTDQLVSTDGASERNQIEDPGQSSLAKEEQARDVSDDEGKRCQLNESARSENITTVEAVNPGSDRQLRQDESSASLKRPGISNPTLRQLPTTPSLNKGRSGDSDGSHNQREAVVQGNQRDPLSADVTPESAGATNRDSRRLSSSEGGSRGSDPKAVTSQRDPDVAETASLGVTSVLSSRPST